MKGPAGPDEKVWSMMVSAERGICLGDHLRFPVLRRVETWAVELAVVNLKPLDGHLGSEEERLLKMDGGVDDSTPMAAGTLADDEVPDVEVCQDGFEKFVGSEDRRHGSRECHGICRQVGQKMRR